jgi:hypothetical protein
LAFDYRLTIRANPETILYVDPSTVMVPVGDSFSINVSVQDAHDLYAFHLFLGYNTIVLDALSVYIYPPFNRGPIITIIDDEDGYVEFSGSVGIPGPGVSGSFPLAMITFNATALGNSGLHLYNTDLRDSMSNPIPHVTSDGSVNVGLIDIAVVNVVPSKSVVGQNYIMNIDVSVENQGDFAETFNVTLYANTSTIETKQITLINGASTTLTFTWNTTGFAKGNYTISAYAWPVYGETDITDNTLIDSWVIVAMVGDITGPNGWPDGKVDARDIGLVCKYFGWAPYKSGYNPNTDINGDGKTDARDIGIVCKQFGKKDP